ncbi:hypothetical protein FJT64_013234 [Amphibalanus amphitrite]|uniref:Uncharacterized protein n=1 Tax=Amphibalanus amphitrite TaxID=1232801 RepID=A0A6A4VA24_AMPAM|nr:hypothetical protein FJT64_013234 [Amphibalanus amphitrite]
MDVLQLMVTGFLLLCFIKRRNRFSYLIKLSGFCCLVSAVLCVVITVTTAVVHIHRLQTLTECVFAQSVHTCTCFAGRLEDPYEGEEVSYVFRSVPDCNVIHGALFSCLRALFGLSVIGALVCIFSCMLVYQLLSHERKKMYWEQLELRQRYFFQAHPPFPPSFCASEPAWQQWEFVDDLTSRQDRDDTPPRSVTAPFGLGGGRQSVPVRHASRSNDGVFHHLTAQRYSSPPALGQLAWSHWGPPPPYSQPPSLQNITQDSGPSTPGSLMRAAARQTPVAPHKRQDGDGDNLSFKSEALDVTSKSPACGARAAMQHGRVGMTGSLPTRQRGRTIAGRSLEDILNSKTSVEERSPRSAVTSEERSALSLYGRYKRPLFTALDEGPRGLNVDRAEDIPGDCSGVYYIPNVSEIISHGTVGSRAFPSGRKQHAMQCGLEADRPISPPLCSASRSPRPASPVYAANHVLPLAVRVGPEGASTPHAEPLRRPLLLFGSTSAVRDCPSGVSSSTASPRSETSSCFSPPSRARSPSRLAAGGRHPRQLSSRSSPQLSRARRAAAAVSPAPASSPCTPLHGRAFGDSDSDQECAHGSGGSPAGSARSGRRRQLLRYVSDDSGSRSAASGGRRRRPRPVRSLSSGRCGSSGAPSAQRKDRFVQERAHSEDLWAVSGEGERGTREARGWSARRQRSEGSQRSEAGKGPLGDRGQSQGPLSAGPPTQLSEPSVARIRRLSRATPARIASVDDDLSARIKRAHVSTFSRSEPSTPLRKHRVKNV